MRRLILLERGEELTPAIWGALAAQSSPVRLKLLEPSPPFVAADIVQVAPLDGGKIRPRDLLLFRSGAAFGFGRARDRRVPEAGEPLGRVIAMERGALTLSLRKGVLSRLPPRWLPRGADALELLGRFRHPLTPALYLGSVEACLAGVRDKYDQPLEAQEYSNFVGGELDPTERDLVTQHVKAAGRLLDVGCGAGREALGLARMGFRVFGIDIARRMIEAARANALREGLPITFRILSVTDLDEPPGSFDGAYWAGSYHHIPSRALRVQTLRRIGRALTAEGALILMVAYGGKRGLLSRSRLVDCLRAGLRRLPGSRQLSEPGDGLMREVSEASDSEGACFFHDFWTAGAVRAEIEAAGLSAVEVAKYWWVCRRHGESPAA
jgi:SAM-dependent methyltransferase